MLQAEGRLGRSLRPVPPRLGLHGLGSGLESGLGGCHSPPSSRSSLGSSFLRSSLVAARSPYGELSPAKASGERGPSVGSPPKLGGMFGEQRAAGSPPGGRDGSARSRSHSGSSSGSRSNSPAPSLRRLSSVSSLFDKPCVPHIARLAECVGIDEDTASEDGCAAAWAPASLSSPTTFRHRLATPSSSCGGGPLTDRSCCRSWTQSPRALATPRSSILSSAVHAVEPQALLSPTRTPRRPFHKRTFEEFLLRATKESPHREQKESALFEFQDVVDEDLQEWMLDFLRQRLMSCVAGRTLDDMGPELEAQLRQVHKEVLASVDGGSTPCSPCSEKHSISSMSTMSSLYSPRSASSPGRSTSSDLGHEARVKEHHEGSGIFVKQYEERCKGDLWLWASTALLCSTSSDRRSERYECALRQIEQRLIS